MASVCLRILKHWSAREKGVGACEGILNKGMPVSFQISLFSLIYQTCVSINQSKKREKLYWAGVWSSGDGAAILKFSYWLQVRTVCCQSIIYQLQLPWRLHSQGIAVVYLSIYLSILFMPSLFYKYARKQKDQRSIDWHVYVREGIKSRRSLVVLSLESSPHVLTQGGGRMACEAHLIIFEN